MAFPCEHARRSCEEKSGEMKSACRRARDARKREENESDRESDSHRCGRDGDAARAVEGDRSRLLQARHSGYRVSAAESSRGSWQEAANDLVLVAAVLCPSAALRMATVAVRRELCGGGRLLAVRGIRILPFLLLLGPGF